MANIGLFERVAQQVATQYAPKVKIPDKVLKHLPLANILLKGLFGEGNVANEKFGTTPSPQLGVALQSPSPLIGGITMRRAREISQQVLATEFAKKNLYFVGITDLARNEPESDLPDFNMFCTAVSYSPITIPGEQYRLGSATVDIPTQRQLVEARFTTLDDSRGSIKRWFEARAERCAHRDGTFGIPIDYLSRVEIMHAYIGEEAEAAQSAKVDTYIMRPGALELDLTRREDGHSELQFTMTEADTYSILT